MPFSKQGDETLWVCMYRGWKIASATNSPKAGRWQYWDGNLSFQKHCMQPAIHLYPPWTGLYLKHSHFRLQRFRFPQLHLMARTRGKKQEKYAYFLLKHHFLPPCKCLMPRNATSWYCAPHSARVSKQTAATWLAACNTQHPGLAFPDISHFKTVVRNAVS